MTIAEILEAIETWQSNTEKHPLTCGSDGRHRPLRAVGTRSTVYLKCPDCNYQQTSIPDVVLLPGDPSLNDPRR